jgi:hypothetical protein
VQSERANASSRSVLVALLFVADATLEENGAPVIVTSQRTGLPTPRYHNANEIKTLTNLPAPEPDMTSQAVLAAQPKSAPNALPKIGFEARDARAEVPPKNARASGKHARAEALPQIQRVAQPTDSQQKIESERREAPPPENYQQNQFDRFSIKGY